MTENPQPPKHEKPRKPITPVDVMILMLAGGAFIMAFLAIGDTTFGWWEL